VSDMEADVFYGGLPKIVGDNNTEPLTVEVRKGEVTL
jgi:hypothetical protein